jgi:hypothetical protein
MPSESLGSMPFILYAFSKGGALQVRSKLEESAWKDHWLGDERPH